MQIFAIALSKTKEFSVIGIANVASGDVVFQGLINGIPFIASLDYNEVRDYVYDAVDLNTPQNNENLS